MPARSCSWQAESGHVVEPFVASFGLVTCRKSKVLKSIQPKIVSVVSFRIVCSYNVELSVQKRTDE